MFYSLLLAAAPHPKLLLAAPRFVFDPPTRVRRLQPEFACRSDALPHLLKGVPYNAENSKWYL